MKKGVSFVFVVILFVGIGFVSAEHVVTTEDGESEFIVDQNVSATFSLIVNNTDVGNLSEILQVNVTLPTEFTFENGSEGSNTLHAEFSREGDVFTWENWSSFVVDSGEENGFWFGALTPEVGIYNLTITTTNATGVSVNYLTIRVKDLAIFDFASPLDGENFSQDFINATVNVSGNSSELDVLKVELYDSEATLLQSNLTNDVFLSEIFNNLSDDIYTIYVTVNDTFGSESSSSVEVALDNIAPVLNLTLDNAGEDYLELDLAIDDITGANGFCTVDRGDAIVTGGLFAQTIEEDNLDCGETYDYMVDCTDYVGLTTSVSGSFDTDNCSDDSTDDGDNTNSDSGSGDDNQDKKEDNTKLAKREWKYTYDEGVGKDLTKGILNYKLRSLQRMEFKVDGETHHVGVVSEEGGGVRINVSSDKSYEVVLKKGEEEKFEVTGDDFYDLNAKVNLIIGEITNLTVSYLHEKIPSAPEVTDENGTKSDGITGFASEGEGGKVNWSWVSLFVLVVGLFVGGLYYMKRAGKDFDDFKKWVPRFKRKKQTISKIPQNASDFNFEGS